MYDSSRVSMGAPLVQIEHVSIAASNYAKNAIMVLSSTTIDKLISYFIFVVQTSLNIADDCL